MDVIRERRIVKWSVLAIMFVAVLLCIASAIPEPDNTPDIEQSRALRLGMSYSEVAAIMGNDKAEGRINGVETYSYGTATIAKYRKWYRIWKWIGLVPTGPEYTSFPVHVRFDESERVDRIERSGTVEEAASASW